MTMLAYGAGARSDAESGARQIYLSKIRPRRLNGYPSPSSCMKLPCAFVVLTLALIASLHVRAADAPPATLPLGTFESGMDYWDFTNGPEFKGATGSVSR